MHGYRPISATVHPDWAEADANISAATAAAKRMLLLDIGAAIR
jgi:hypothetical protein